MMILLLSVWWIVIGVVLDNVFDIYENVVIVYDDGKIFVVGLVEDFCDVYLDVDEIRYLYYLIMFGLVNSYYYFGLILL